MNLTEKQENFAVEYTINGGDATAAYRKCYDTKTKNDGSVWVMAHNVLHNDKVALRVKDLRMAEYSKHILTIDERKQLLTRMSLEGDTKALEILNKMEGVYIEKKEVQVVAEVKSGVGELYKAMND